MTSRHFVIPAVLLCALLPLLGACQRTAPPASVGSPALAAVAAPAEHGGPHWDYGEEAGPAAWGRLSTEFSACGEGRSQSPIDIVAAAPSVVPEMSASYRPAVLRIAHHQHEADVENTGHTIQVDYPEADSLTVAGESFPLLQYHFHSPSEHTLGGRRFPMEMHLVHKSAEGRLAVIGVFIEEGEPNAAFAPVWNHLPAQKGSEVHLEHVLVDVDALLPANRATYRYDGSLTTPPCSEGVRWFVMQTPVRLSAEQIQRFRAIIQGNNRPVQPLNGRIVATERMTEER